MRSEIQAYVHCHICYIVNIFYVRKKYNFLYFGISYIRNSYRSWWCAVGIHMNIMIKYGISALPLPTFWKIKRCLVMYASIFWKRWYLDVSLLSKPMIMMNSIFSLFISIIKTSVYSPLHHVHTKYISCFNYVKVQFA